MAAANDLPGHPNNQCLVNDATAGNGTGETFCAEPCPAQDGDAVCLAQLGPGFSCAAVGASEHFCVPNKGTCKHGLGRLGEDCSELGPDDCVTGVCRQAGINGLQSICSAQCQADAECGDARYHCCTIVTLGDGTQTYDCTQRNASNDGPSGSQGGVCAPPGGAFGDDCSAGRPPCTSGACLDLGTAQLCSAFCATTDDCPADFLCQSAQNYATSDATQVCFPAGGGVAGISG